MLLLFHSSSLLIPISPLRFIVVEFKSPEDAAYAIGVMHGHPFDSKHRFSLNRFTDIERYANLDETYVEPEPEPYVQKVRFTVAIS